MAAVNATLGNILQVYTSNYNTTGPPNSTAYSISEGTSAACYIITVVGFFAIVMFILMISNLIANKTEEECDPYFQYIEKLEKKKDTIQKLSKSKLVQFGKKAKQDKHKIKNGEATIIGQGREEPSKKQEEEQPQEHAVDPGSLHSVEVKT